MHQLMKLVFGFKARPRGGGGGTHVIWSTGVRGSNG